MKSYQCDIMDSLIHETARCTVHSYNVRRYEYLVSRIQFDIDEMFFVSPWLKAPAAKRILKEKVAKLDAEMLVAKRNLFRARLLNIGSKARMNRCINNLTAAGLGGRQLNERSFYLLNQD